MRGVGLGIARGVNDMGLVAAPAGFSDNFNRADGALGANWSKLSGSDVATISTNRFYVGSAVDASMYVVAASGFDNVANVSVSVKSYNTTNLLRVVAVCRVSANGANYYGVMVNSSGTVYILKNGSVLTTGTATGVASGVKVEVRAVGNLISAYINDVFIVSTTDSAYASGRVGIATGYAAGQALPADDFVMLPL